MAWLASSGSAIRTGIGRNVELFDCTRFWAYRHARDHKNGLFEQWHAAVRERAMFFNADLFSDPLGTAEVLHTAKSIARWVWFKEREMTAAFHSRQTARSKNAAKARKATAQARHLEAIEIAL